MPVLIIRHIAQNTLGPLEEVLSSARLPFEYVHCEAITPAQRALEQVDGLILLGGKESVADDGRHAFMKPEQQMIRDAIAQSVPVFGICLGSQMMARALGAVVEKNRVNHQEVKEIGWTPLTLSEEGQSDPVLRQLEGVSQFQWHEDTYHLPQGAVRLAMSELCAQQAFRWNKRTYGVQFHPEMSLPVIKAWLAESQTLSAERKAAIWEESQQRFSERTNASQKMFSAFCEQAFQVKL